MKQNNQMFPCLIGIILLNHSQAELVYVSSKCKLPERLVKIFCFQLTRMVAAYGTEEK